MDKLLPLRGIIESILTCGLRGVQDALAMGKTQASEKGYALD